MIKKPKKRNPADTTMRNINALKKQIEGIDQRLRILANCVKDIILEMKK
jgi:hypothetical protein